MPRIASRPSIAADSAKPSQPSTLTLTLTLSEEDLDAIAERVAARVAPPAPERTPWLDTAGAAEYLAAKPGRIHDLVALRRLTPRRDGRRLLFRRSDLDAYLEASA
jgi:excisionase family DNA binding protein